MECRTKYFSLLHEDRIIFIRRECLHFLSYRSDNRCPDKYAVERLRTQSRYVQTGFEAVDLPSVCVALDRDIQVSKRFLRVADHFTGNKDQVFAVY